MRKLLSLSALSALFSALAVSTVDAPALACTGIRVTATDGSVIQARTLEFGIDLKSQAIVVPRGFARTGTTPDGAPGMRWTSKYASVGANAYGLPILLNGVNEKGLATGLFYFPGMAEYMPYEPQDADKTLAAFELGSYVLDNCATVEEARQAVRSLVVPAVVFPQLGFSPGVHYIVMDATGESIVIEYTGGEARVFDNPLGVITNCPTFDWHMTNLRNYLKLSPVLAPPLVLEGVTLESFGQGSGMLGMPGDFTPPSRFVRAVAFSQSMEPTSDGEQAVLAAFHVLNNFDIPRGVVRDRQKDAHGNTVCEETQWTCACDLKAKRFYFRTYENSRIRMVDLTAMDPQAAEIVTFSMQGGEQIETLSPPAGKRLAAALE